METANELIVAQGGVRIPTGAGVGKMAVSDAAGNINWGAVALSWRGAYSGSNSYAIGDIASYQGSLYRANTAVSSSPAIGYIGSGSATCWNSGDQNINLPAGTIAGHMMVLTLSAYTGTNVPSPTTTGFTNVVSMQNGWGGLYVFYKTVTAGDVAAGHVSITGQGYLAMLRVYSNAGAPHNVTTNSGSFTGTSGGAVTAVSSSYDAAGDTAINCFCGATNYGLSAGTFGGSGALHTVNGGGFGGASPCGGTDDLAVATAAGASPTTVTYTVPATGGGTTNWFTSTLVISPRAVFNATQWDIMAGTPPHACTVTGTASLPGESSPGATAKIDMNTVVLDIDNWWDGTNHRYKPQLAGRYLVHAFFNGTAVGGSGTFWDLGVAKNGALNPIWLNRLPSSTAYGPNIVTTAQLVMNGTTDYIELFGGQGNGSAITGTERMEIVYLGPS